MYWNVYSMKNLFILILTTALLFGCNTASEEGGKKKESKPKLSFEESIARKVELSLGINAAEEYDLKIVKEYINPDTLKDALILVNRKQWAHERAKRNDNEAFMESTGFVGPFNHVFVKLGGSSKLLETPSVGSSADHKLDHKFLRLTSQAHNDFFVEYRVRNSMYRNYYTVRGDRLYLTFNCPVYDSIGYEDPRAFAIKHEESSVRIAKDIALYKGKIVGYDHTKIEDPETYSPQQIVALPELFVYFIFDEKSMKYKTPMKPKEKD